MNGKPQATIMRKAPNVSPARVLTPRRTAQLRYSVVQHQINLPRNYFSPYAYRQ